uniref:Glycosyltransferase RgtA/B/C/D-like domain-containing protein n=1 Tax=Desulfobacca acetoxidans TaxID=60893 RepID=A0A7C3V9L8_9BACT
MIEAALLLVRLILGLAGILIMGYSLAAGLVPGFTRLERAAAGFGLGALVITLWMLALSGLELEFSLPLVIMPPLALAGGWWLGKSWIAAPHSSGRETKESELRKPPYSFWDWLFIGLLAVLGLFVTLRAVLYPLWAWDGIAIWGFKAKVFYLNGAIDFKGFEAHNYYPNLVPLILTYLYLWLGQVNDYLVKLIFPLWGGALLAMLFGMLRRLGLARTPALGVTTFFALNGITFITHLHIVYADLAMTYFALGATGLVYLWLTNAAPPRTLPLAALFFAGLTWSKFEGAPLAGTILLAAGITLIWLRPPTLARRLASLGWPVAGLLLGYLPWRVFALSHGIETGSDPILGFYWPQLFRALPALGLALINPTLFGILWPTTGLVLVFSGRKIFSTPILFLALFLGGNFLAILLAYAVAPTSPFEFHLYLRATLDRLLLHLAPVAALLIGEGVTEVAGRERQGEPEPAIGPSFQPVLSTKK